MVAVRCWEKPAEAVDRKQSSSRWRSKEKERFMNKGFPEGSGVPRWSGYRKALKKL
jgi:hypothetical protein